MNYKKFVAGRVFVVPLLGGQYAFGVLTFFDPVLGVFCDIYDYVSSESEPPEDIVNKPDILRDLQVGPEFFLKPKAECGNRWTFTNIFSKTSIFPHNRYYKIGTRLRGFKRVDLEGIEPDISLTQVESEQYKSISYRYVPYNTAYIEVEVRRLTVTPEELIASWRRKPS